MATTMASDKTFGSTVKAPGPLMPLQSSKACVLIVEDHEDTRFMLRTVLETRSGISVVEAENGVMAIHMAQHVHPDLILIDGNLPLIDGYEATRRIRELASTCEVPIVFLSGHAQREAEDKAFAAGCTDYLVKPFDLGKLVSVVERHLVQNKAN